MKLSTVDDCIAYFNGHGLKPLDGTACDNAFSLKELAPIVRCIVFWFFMLTGKCFIHRALNLGKTY